MTTEHRTAATTRSDDLENKKKKRQNPLELLEPNVDRVYEIGISFDRVTTPLVQ